MGLTILGLTTDLRTNTPVVYAQAPIREYLAIIGEDFDEFVLQRRREKHKAYDRMREDIKNGALLPAITLAVKPEKVAPLLPAFHTSMLGSLTVALSTQGQTHILDGLQRTYIISELAREGFVFKERQSLLLEIWLEKEVKHLSYRMIILNAGQKPMSMRHQIEILFATIRSNLQNRVPGLEIYTEREETRRRRAKKYALDRVAVAYQCFLSATPETDRKNIVAQNLIDEAILDSTEDELSDKFDQFVALLRRYADIDEHVCRVYATERENSGIPTGASWFGSENVMNSFFAAVAQYGSIPDRLDRTHAALDRLLETLRIAQSDDDPFGLEILHAIQGGFNPRKINIGLATRRLLTNGFKEYFRDEGATSLADCWKLASE